MESNKKTIIIGGGLSGLTLAYLLSKRGISSTVLEASDRLGGRIQTVSGVHGTPLELGATWFSDVHHNLLDLIRELNLVKYPQFSGGISLFQTKSFEPPQRFLVPASQSPSYRIAGGTQALIDRLTARLPAGNIQMEKRVATIARQDNGLAVLTTDGTQLTADQVVICLPPSLAAASIQFSPGLPETVSQLLPTVQTWMAGAIKFTLEYNEAFWRKEGYSGMLYSHAGIVTEMYDHTNFEENKFGFTGFLNGSAATYSTDVRKELVLTQLRELLGPRMGQPSTYFDKVWNDEFVSGGSQTIFRPHQNNGHMIFRSTYMDGRMHFCGTETSGKFAGYMEGAVFAAKSAAEKLSK